MSGNVLTIDSLKNFFGSKDEVELAFLFGSQSKSEKSRHPDSDYDIAVWFKNNSLSIEQINKLWEELINLLHKEVDLVVLNTARPTVAWAALRGKKLSIKNFKLYLRLFLDVSREAEDIQDFTNGLWYWKKRILSA